MSKTIVKPTLSLGNHIYLYRLLRDAIGCGKQTFMTQVEEALAAGDMAAYDLGFESTRELLEELDDCIRLTVFKGGRLYATLIANEAWDAALAKGEDKPKAAKGAKQSYKKKKRGEKDLKAVRPKHVKRAEPDNIVFTYQGDGDLASIGMAETVHSAARNENITVIFINNAIYGMTGGQMAPTSLPGQVTQTSPYGRDVTQCGYPVKVCELLSQLDGAEYLERVAVNNVKNVKNAKKAIKKAFQNQIDGKGFSLVEVISSCPTNWGLTPQNALKWIEEKMIPYYPLGVYKDRSAAKEETK